MRRDVSRRSVGIHFDVAGKANIAVWAPERKQIELIIGGSKEPVPLVKDDSGYWTVATTAIRPGDQYTFRIDGKEEFPDPASLFQPEDVHGSSQAINLKAFKWNEAGWKNFPLQEYIIYELH